MAEQLPEEDSNTFQGVLQALYEIEGGPSQFVVNSHHENLQPLVEVVDGLNEGLITSLISENTGSKKLRDFVKGIFHGASLSSATGLAKRCAVFETIVRLIATGKLEGKPCKVVLDFLLTELDHMPESAMPCLVEVVVAQTPPEASVAQRDTNRCEFLEFVPKCLHILKQAEMGTLDPEQRCVHNYSAMDGFMFVQMTIEKLCELEWNTTYAITILSIFCEIVADIEEVGIRLITCKTLDVIYQCSLMDVPSLVGELLLFLSQQSAKVQSEALMKVIQHFDSDSYAQTHPDPEGNQIQIVPELRSKVQGAILNRFNLAVSQNLKLGRTFIKQCTDFVGHFSCFRLAMLLSLMRIKRLETSVQTLIVKRLHHSVESALRQRYSKWVQTSLSVLGVDEAPPAAEPNTQSQLSSSSIDAGMSYREQRVLLELVRHSSQGTWDLVVPGLLTLGIALIESCNTYAPTLPIGSDVPRSQTEAGGNSAPMSNTQEPVDTSTWTETNLTEAAAAHTAAATRLCSNLGTLLLSECFARHSITRRDLLGRIVERLIVSNAVGFSNSTCPLAYIRLLSELVVRCPHLLLEDVAMLKDMLTYLPTMLPRVAVSVQLTLSKLLALRPDLMDYLLLVFRKALFQAELSSRLVAVHGLLFLIKQAHVDEQEQDGATQESSHEATVSEIQIAALSCLRRCFSQQPQVRIALYAGLGALLAELRSLSPDLLRMTNSHLLQYMDESQDSFIVNISHCVSRGTGQVVDPLHFLVSEVITSKSTTSIGSTTVRELVDKFKASDIESFGIENESEELKTSSLNMCKILSGCCEALMNSVGHGQITLIDVLSLWKLTARVEEFVESSSDVSEHSVQPGKSKKKRTKTRRAKTLITERGDWLSGETVEKILCELVAGLEGDAAFEEEFVSYVLQRALSIITLPDQHTVPGKAAPMGTKDQIWTTVELSKQSAGGTCLQIDTERWGKYFGKLFQMFWDEKATNGAKEVSLLCLKCILGLLESIEKHCERRSMLQHIFETDGTEAVHSDGTSQSNSNQQQLPELILLKLCTSSIASAEICIIAIRILNASVRTPAALIGTRELLQHQHSKTDLNFAQNLLAYHFELELLNSNDVRGIVWVARRLQFLHGVHSEVSDEGDESDMEDDPSMIIEPNWQGVEESVQELGTLASATLGSAELHQLSATKQVLPACKNLKLRWLDHRTSRIATKVYVSTLTAILDETMWIFQHYLTRSGLENDQRLSLEKALFLRLQNIAIAVQPLSFTQLPSGSESQVVLRLLSQLFNSTGQLMKNYISLKMERTSTSWLYRTLKVIGTQLSVSVYGLINNLQRVMDNGSINREMKLIPDLVFQLEQFDVYILKLIKMGLLARDFQRLVKRAPARDFRISGGSTKSKRVQVAPEDEQDTEPLPGEKRKHGDDEAEEGEEEEDNDGDEEEEDNDGEEEEEEEDNDGEEEEEEDEAE